MRQLIISAILVLVLVGSAIALEPPKIQPPQNYDWITNEYVFQDGNYHYLLDFRYSPQILQYQVKYDDGSGIGWGPPVFFSRYQYNPETNVIDLIDTQYEVEPYDSVLQIYRKRQRVIQIYDVFGE